MESTLLVVRPMFDILEKLNDADCEHHDRAWYQELLIETGSWFHLLIQCRGSTDAFPIKLMVHLGPQTTDITPRISRDVFGSVEDKISGGLI
jgi:hypothetical protein